ncbi:MAG TPA: cytochrome c [Lutibacter sp.]|nr:cytochrome c [Lutibacter sp.]
MSIYKNVSKLLILLLSFASVSVYAQEAWIVPDAENAIVNPIQNSEAAIVSGQKLYKSLCVACHGNLGAGDGVAAVGLNPKPTDFTTADFHKQTAGSVFWKLSKGRGVMAPYEGMLSEEDRWALVSYLKSLKVEIPKKKVATKKVNNTFLFTQLINTQTVQTLPNKISEFTIQHRFGVTQLNSDFINDFLGMDLGANLRLAYAKAINSRLYAEIGRTRYGKTYDLGAKYLVLQQTIDNKTPFSIAVYGNMGINTQKFPKVIDGSTFVDGSNFSYSFAHRLSFNSQIIFAKQFSESFSMQIAPVVIWHNLVAKDEKNLDFVIPFGARLELNQKSALLFEVTPKIIAKNKRMPLSIAYEIASSSAHAFQLILTSTDRILEQSIYSNETIDYSQGKFVLGFNIKRLF